MAVEQEGENGRSRNDEGDEQFFVLDDGLPQLRGDGEYIPAFRARVGGLHRIALPAQVAHCLPRCLPDGSRVGLLFVGVNKRDLDGQCVRFGHVLSYACFKNSSTLNEEFAMSTHMLEFNAGSLPTKVSRLCSSSLVEAFNQD